MPSDKVPLGWQVLVEVTWEAIFLFLLHRPPRRLHLGRNPLGTTEQQSWRKSKRTTEVPGWRLSLKLRLFRRLGRLYRRLRLPKKSTVLRTWAAYSQEAFQSWDQLQERQMGAGRTFLKLQAIPSLCSCFYALRRRIREVNVVFSNEDFLLLLLRRVQSQVWLYRWVFITKVKGHFSVSVMWEVNLYTIFWAFSARNSVLHWKIFSKDLLLAHFLQFLIRNEEFILVNLLDSWHFGFLFKTSVRLLFPGWFRGERVLFPSKSCDIPVVKMKKFFCWHEVRCEMRKDSKQRLLLQWFGLHGMLVFLASESRNY